jgi:hypothetical protein
MGKKFNQRKKKTSITLTKEQTKNEKKLLAKKKFI